MYMDVPMILQRLLRQYFIIPIMCAIYNKSRCFSKIRIIYLFLITSHVEMFNNPVCRNNRLHYCNNQADYGGHTVAWNQCLWLKELCARWPSFKAVVSMPWTKVQVAFCFSWHFVHHRHYHIPFLANYCNIPKDYIWIWHLV